MTNLLDFRKAIFSQSGEEGIIEHIFNVFGTPKNLFCADFGAWDGTHLSNTRNLIINHGWGSLQIEGDPSKSEECLKNYSEYPVISLCCFVDHNKDSEYSFDNICKKYIPNKKIDFLSIDVDGPDYDIFESITEFLPDVLCIEVSAGVDPLSHERLSIADAIHFSGQGLTAMTDLANNKGYQLVAYSGNAFYVKNNLFPLLEISDNSPETIYRNFWKIQKPEDKKYLLGWCNMRGVINPLMLEHR